MAKINFEEIEELASVRGEVYISIFIPTHRHGQEVNNGNDKITFKAELLNIKKHLIDLGHHPDYVSNLLKPALELMEDQFAWRYMEEGLAVFISDNYFKKIALPYHLEKKYFIAKEFILTPIISVFNSTDKFYILNLNQDHVSLYLAGQYEIEEVSLEDKNVPVAMEKFMSVYDFEPYNHGISRTGIGSHGTREEIDRKYRYVQEFCKQLGNGLRNTFLESNIPIVLAGTDNMTGAYRSVNSTYNNIAEETIKGNFQDPKLHELKEKGWNIVRPQFQNNYKKQVEKYHAWAGSGKASYNLEEIFDAALHGRVETVFIKKNAFKWGTFKSKGKFVVHKDQKLTDLDLYNQIAIQTILNKGKAYIVEDGMMPENSVDIDLAATYRY